MQFISNMFLFSLCETNLESVQQYRLQGQSGARAACLNVIIAQITGVFCRRSHTIGLGVIFDLAAVRWFY